MMNRMTATLFLVGVLVAAMGLRGAADDAPAVTTVYLVRHAEKVDESRDAALSDVGQERAKTLAWMLRDVAFDAAYSTNYQRTRDTIKPLVDARSLALDVSTPPNRLEQTIRTKHAGQVVLVSGHSNTVPHLLRDFGIEYPEKLLTGYDDLFVVTLVGSGDGAAVASLQRLHYSAKH